MLTNIRKVLLLVALWTFFLTILPIQALAAERCSITFNPSSPAIDSAKIEVTVGTSTLPTGADNKYWVTLTAPNQNNASKRGVTLDAQGRTTVVFDKPSQNWQVGTYTLYFRPEGGGGLSNQNLSCNPQTIEVTETPVQTSCVVTLGTDLPITPAKRVVLNFSGLQTHSALNPLGGYNVYLNGDSKQTIRADSSGNASVDLGTLPVNNNPPTYKVEVRNRCGVAGVFCTPRIQCATFNFTVVPLDAANSRPVCSIIPAPSNTSPTTTDPIVVQVTNVTSDKTYSSWLDGDYTRRRDSKKPNTGQSTVNLNIGEKLSAGDHKAEVYEGDNLICAVNKFTVVAPSSTASSSKCTISPKPTNDKVKVFIKATDLVSETTYKSFLDDKEVMAKTTGSIESTVNFDLGERLSRGSHKAEVKDLNGNIICTENFQVTAESGSAQVSSGISAGGTPCIDSGGNSNSDRIATAIGCIPTKPEVLAAEMLKVASGLSGGVALLMMIAGSFQMITSVGNPEAVKKGQEKFVSAVIGLLFIIFSVALLEIIGVDILGLPGFGR